MNGKLTSLHLLTMTLLVCCGQLSTAQDGTVYVDHQIGEDSCNNYAPSERTCGPGNYTAFSGIQAAADRARPGVHVLIQSGTYQGGVIVRRGGNESAPIIFRATGPGVIIDGSGDQRDAFFITEANHVHVEGLVIQNARRAGLRISLSDHVEIRDSVFRNNGSWGVFTDFSDYTLVENCEASGSASQHGVYISNSSDYPTIRGNRIHNNAAAGLHMNGDASMGGDGLVSHAIIETNIIYENGRRGASGINLDGVTHSIIRNNLLYENHASGISLYKIDGADHSHSNLVLNNTIVNGRFSRWALNMPSTENNRVFNNIILNNNRFRGSILVNTPVGDGFKSDYNIVMDRFSLEGDLNRSLSLEGWQELGYDQNSQIGNILDLFVDWSGDDFHLPQGSKAIDRGINLEDISTDLEGAARPVNGATDIGAFEYSP